MKHAYLLLVHENNKVLETLIEMIDDDRNDIYIHVDRSCYIEQFYYLKSKIRFARITFLQNRYNISWGSFEMVSAELELINQAITDSQPYSFLHLLSGADLPIKNQDYIHNFFSKNNRNIFIEFWNDGEEKLDFYLDRYKYYEIMKMKKRNFISKLFYHIIRKFSICFQKLLRINRIKKNDVSIYLGSQWFSITEKFGKTLLNNSKLITTVYKDTLVPDESFIQTLAIYKNLKKDLFTIQGKSTNMRHIVFEDGKPKIWTIDDYNILLKSEGLFARKFDETIDVQIIKKLKEDFGNNVK